MFAVRMHRKHGTVGGWTSSGGARRHRRTTLAISELIRKRVSELRSLRDSGEPVAAEKL